MNFFINNRNTLWKILGLLLILSANLFAEVEVVQQESVDMAFSPLNSMSIILIFVLTSLLGAFFMKDELENSL